MEQSEAVLAKHAYFELGDVASGQNNDSNDHPLNSEDSHSPIGNRTISSKIVIIEEEEVEETNNNENDVAKKIEGERRKSKRLHYPKISLIVREEPFSLKEMVDIRLTVLGWYLKVFFYLTLICIFMAIYCFRPSLESSVVVSSSQCSLSLLPPVNNNYRARTKHHPMLGAVTTHKRH